MRRLARLALAAFDLAVAVRREAEVRRAVHREWLPHTDAPCERCRRCKPYELATARARERLEAVR